MIDEATQKASQGNTGDSFAPDPGWEDTAKRVIHDPVWAGLLADLAFQGLTPRDIRDLVHRHAHTPLSTRQELAARFAVAAIRSRFSFAGPSDTADWTFRLADAILADGKEEA